MANETVSKLKTKDWRPTSDSRIKKRYNGELYARFTKYGHRIEQRLHEETLAAAKVACDLIEEYLRQGKTPNQIKEHFSRSLASHKKDDVVLIGEHWGRFVSYRSEGDPLKKLKPWRPKTRKEYISFWTRSFESFWANMVPSEITKKNWQRFIESEQKRSQKGKNLTFDNHVKYFSCFSGWLVETGALQKHPVIWNPNWVSKESDEDEDFGVVFTDEQIMRILDADLGSPAFQCFIYCAALMGMRSSEITQLRKDRVDLDRRVIRLRASDVKTGSKTGKGRTVPIHPQVFTKIKAQIASNGSEFVFPNRHDDSRPMDPTGFYGRWDELKNVCKIEEGTPHHLRHTYATKAFADSKLNPVLVCKALGMSMQTAMRVYIHFTEEQLLTVSERFSYSTSAGLL